MQTCGAPFEARGVPRARSGPLSPVRSLQAPREGSYLGEPGGHRAHELLHTHYVERKKYE
ncbi:MAG: iron hydrogenase small subunit [Firmicutes bacterium]|nr:iron hydrogenase small subunit [Bacillota bacterium]